MKIIIFLILLQQIIFACGETIKFQNATVIILTEKNVKVHAFKPDEYIVSSYIIELPTKLVVIDLQLNPQLGDMFYKYAVSLGKTIDRSILTHYHFDHWNGYDSFSKVSPVYALSESIIQIRNFYVNGRPNEFRERAIEFLNYSQPVKLGCETIDGVKFKFERIQGGENLNTLIISLPMHQVVAVGDLVYNKFHVYVGETTDFSRWLSILNYLKNKFPYRNILIGHGDPARQENYQETIDYIDYVRNIANTFKTLDEYRASILKVYPNYGNEAIVNCPFTNLACPYGSF
jgi:glyoxylase-like metal-dependent hydrolase (beta-lactamase superfamily II)